MKEIIGQRLAKLRKLMRQRDLDAYLVPSADPHMSEYLPERWKRRQFMSGFDGSAGTLLVTGKWAGLWTDSRYFLQAEEQLAGTGIELMRQGEPGVPELEPWLRRHLPVGARLGLDGQVLSLAAWMKLRADCPGLKLVEVHPDLVERLWGRNLPGLPAAPVRTHPLKYAGESIRHKLERLRRWLQEKEALVFFTGALDEIAWLLNLRGADIEHNQFFLAYLMVDARRATLYTRPERLRPDARRQLRGLVELRPYEDVEQGLRRSVRPGGRIVADALTTNHRIAAILERQGAQLVLERSPLARWKAVKNQREIEGMRQAQIRESLCVTRLLYWLENESQRRSLYEADVVERMEQLRRQFRQYLGPSFSTIAAFGPNGAIVHYGVKGRGARLGKGLVLIDTGGQYLDGTSDLTRTVALGKPGAEERRAYTTVLRGLVAISRAVFRQGSDGYQLDILARAPLWSSFLHYGHGTGHGLGAALGVHEGPFILSLRKVLEPLEAGNVLSLEPGVYLPGRFGVRLENIALVTAAGSSAFGDFLAFETLTLCPFDRRLIDSSRLEPLEKQQIDSYHQKVLKTLGPELEARERTWLRDLCRPL